MSNIMNLIDLERHVEQLGNFSTRWVTFDAQKLGRVPRQEYIQILKDMFGDQLNVEVAADKASRGHSAICFSQGVLPIATFMFQDEDEDPEELLEEEEGHTENEQQSHAQVVSPQAVKQAAPVAP